MQELRLGNLIGKAGTYMKKKKRIMIGCCIVVALLIPFFIWQNNYLTETTYNYDVSNIDPALNGMKIAQISDLHNKKFGSGQKKLLKKLENYQPDIIVVTGDVVDSNHVNVDVALDFLAGAVKIAPTYYVIGNHEMWLETNVLAELKSGMEALGVYYMDNECLNLSYGKTTYNLVGLDTDNLFGSKYDQCVEAMNQEKMTILLAHEPQYFDRYCKMDMDLVFTGHAHGGQVRLPFVGGLVAPDQGLFPEYTEGVHVEGATTMIVSRGLGNSIIPVRIFNFPEIVYVELKAE